MNTKIYKYFTNKPKSIFLIDGIGALLSTIGLLCFPLQFHEFFGMPVGMLYVLSAITTLFVLNSFICYFFVSNNWKWFLKVIITANLMYCALTLGIILSLHSQLSYWGFAYFMGEMMIIILLVLIEIKLISNST